MGVPGGRLPRFLAYHVSLPTGIVIPTYCSKTVVRCIKTIIQNSVSLSKLTRCLNDLFSIMPMHVPLEAVVSSAALLPRPTFRIRCTRSHWKCSK